MKIRFVITIPLLAALTLVLCIAQEFIRPNPPSPEGKQALREMLRNRQATNSNAKDKDAAFLEFVSKSQKTDSLSQSGKVVNLRTKVDDSQSRAFGSQAVVRNDTSTGSVRIEANRKDLMYEEGEELELKLTSNVSGYPVIVNLRTDGGIESIYPNEHTAYSRIEAGQTVVYPPKDAKQEYKIFTKPPFGEDRILAFVTQQEFTIKELENTEFYEKRGLLQTAKDSKAFGTVGIKQDDFPCQTITLKTYPKGKRPSTLPKQRLVLLIGPTIYQWEGYRPLPACYNDVKLMAAIFEEFGQVDAIYLLSEKDVIKENVRKAFDVLIEKSRPGDEIFIVWTGHGGSRADTSGTQPTGQTNFLVLYDSKQADSSSVLTDMEFEHWLDDLDGRRIAIFFDACYSKGMIDGKSSAKSSEDKGFNLFANKWKRQEGFKDIRPEQAAVLCSSQVNEKSVVRKDVPVSAMIWCMANYVFDNDKAVSFDDICKYVEKNVPLVVKEQYRREQQPVWINQIGTIFVKP